MSGKQLEVILSRAANVAPQTAVAMRADMIEAMARALPQSLLDARREGDALRERVALLERALNRIAVISFAEAVNADSSWERHAMRLREIHSITVAPLAAVEEKT